MYGGAEAEINGPFLSGNLENREARGATEAVEKKRSPAAVVDEEACTCCGACVEVCPMGAISLKETALVARDECIGCGICIPECPTEAISLILSE
jgi:NAD-dependent dihydropyrimidine dehydrogenase PreA subunit